MCDTELPSSGPNTEQASWKVLTLKRSLPAFFQKTWKNVVKGITLIQRHNQQLQIQQRCTSQARADVQPIGCRLSQHTRTSLTAKQSHSQSRSAI